MSGDPFHHAMRIARLYGIDIQTLAARAHDVEARLGPGNFHSAHVVLVALAELVEEATGSTGGNTPIKAGEDPA